MTQVELDRTLAILKDFQRDTVEHVYRRMYEDANPSTRFLVADEVGLGKTMIARGVIAKAIHHAVAKDPGRRFDVVYICSNSAIARQNINSLNVTGTKNFPLPDRITLLPRDIKNLQKNRVNFISFTPGTSFNVKSGGGKSAERELLHWLLPPDWLETNRQGAISVLMEGAGREGFQWRIDNFTRWYDVDDNLRSQFRDALATGDAQNTDPQQTLRARFQSLAAQLGRRSKLTVEEWVERRNILGALRGVLAATCIASLEPDLVILDEFQRFRDLLRGEDEAARLAGELFSYRDPKAVGTDGRVRVMLLSATPYKMYTLSEETSGEDHYADFVDTVKFLQGDAAKTSSFRDSLERYRHELFRVGMDDGTMLKLARDGVASHLKQVMVRTERLAATPDRSGMLREVPMPTALQAADVSSFLALQRVARAVDYSDTIEFWKSAPYLLNFMEDYQFKGAFNAALEKAQSTQLAGALKASRGLLLDAADIDAYRRIDPANARLRALADDTLGRGVWRLLWMPPSLPYYRLAGAFEGTEGSVTKRLAFSAWHVVPKVVGGLLTYEAERLMMGAPDQGIPAGHSSESRSKKGQRLKFSVATDGRPVGMPALALLYPCRTLAERINPLANVSSTASDLTTVLADTSARCRELLQPIVSTPHSGEIDQRWYWAAPLLLDAHYYPDQTRKWFGQGNLAVHWRGLDREDDEPDLDTEADRGWADHVEVARLMLKTTETLGAPPADLSAVLALQALAGPGTCALRSLTRVARASERVSEHIVRNSAGRVAEGLRRLFNQPDVTVMLRTNLPDEDDDEKATVPYWRRVLEYCADGCLQSVLDEYAHILVEGAGLVNKPWHERVTDVSAEMAGALSLRSANIGADSISVDSATGLPKDNGKLRFRSGFAARYGGRQQDDLAHAERETGLRRSFNSPFWPFVLCSTSVGQEGLDFHRYCHAVVHWNLPSNPVDLEQREGRVHRFKGHAVRKNVAKRFGPELAVDATSMAYDPWTALFDLAKFSRKPEDTDIVPFWVYPIEGGAHIERHVPALPMSRDEFRAEQLRRSLTVYRMAFGHSRQEDVVKYLLGKFEAGDVEAMSRELCIDLAPDRPAAGGQPSLAGYVPVEDIELFEEETAPTTHGVSLSALERLLDDFASVRPMTPHGLTPGAIAELLDTFSAVAARPPRDTSL